jgi:hypothetical protein
MAAGGPVTPVALSNSFCDLKSNLKHVNFPPQFPKYELLILLNSKFIHQPLL